MHGVVCARGENELVLVLNEPVDERCTNNPGGAANWLLILIALMDWIESKYYQGMDVDIVKVCKGEQY